MKIKVMEMQNPKLVKGQAKDRLESYAAMLVMNDKAIAWIKKELLGV